MAGFESNSWNTPPPTSPASKVTQLPPSCSHLLPWSFADKVGILLFGAESDLSFQPDSSGTLIPRTLRLDLGWTRFISIKYSNLLICLYFLVSYTNISYISSQGYWNMPREGLPRCKTSFSRTVCHVELLHLGVSL
jgi:hypothetical protein